MAGFEPERGTEIVGKDHPAGVSTALALPDFHGFAYLAWFVRVLRREVRVLRAGPVELAVGGPAGVEVREEVLEGLIVVVADAEAQGHVDRRNVAALGKEGLLGLERSSKPMRYILGALRRPRLSCIQPTHCRKLGSSPEKPIRQSVFSRKAWRTAFTKGAKSRGYRR